MRDILTHKLGKEIADLWHGQDENLSNLQSRIKQHWKSGDSRNAPLPLPRNMSWTKALHCYFAEYSVSEEWPHDDTVVEALLFSFENLLQETNDWVGQRPTWLFDILSVRRLIRGKHQRTLDLIRRVIWQTQSIPRVAMTSRALNHVHQLYGEISMALIVETIEPELCQRLFSSDQAEFPWEFPNIFLDAPNQLSFVEDGKLCPAQWADQITRLASGVGQAVFDLYMWYPNSGMHAGGEYRADRLGPLRPQFDRIALLLAAAASNGNNDVRVDPKVFVHNHIRYLDQQNVYYEIDGWKPKADKFRSTLMLNWKLQNPKFDYPTHNAAADYLKIFLETQLLEETE